MASRMLCKQAKPSGIASFSHVRGYFLLDEKVFQISLDILNIMSEILLKKITEIDQRVGEDLRGKSI